MFITVTGLHVWITVWITGECIIKMKIPYSKALKKILIKHSQFQIHTGLVCTFYTTIVSELNCIIIFDQTNRTFRLFPQGGMKAVVWTDTFQTIIMFIALVWIVVKGILNSGGLGQVWTDNWETDRLNLFKYKILECIKKTILWH